MSKFKNNIIANYIASNFGFFNTFEDIKVFTKSNKYLSKI